jgi:hypothetical protein
VDWFGNRLPANLFESIFKFKAPKTKSVELELVKPVVDVFR